MTKPTVAYSVGNVAIWLGVTTAAVSNWLTRHADSVPQPDVVIVSPGGGETIGWTAKRIPEWRKWQRENVRASTPKTRQHRYAPEIPPWEEA